MPRDGAIIFRDLVGKLDVRNVTCDRCGRRGRYHLHKLILARALSATNDLGRSLVTVKDGLGSILAEIVRTTRGKAH